MIGHNNTCHRLSYWHFSVYSRPWLLFFHATSSSYSDMFVEKHIWTSVYEILNSCICKVVWVEFPHSGVDGERGWRIPLQSGLGENFPIFWEKMGGRRSLQHMIILFNRNLVSWTDTSRVFETNSPPPERLFVTVNHSARSFSRCLPLSLLLQLSLFPLPPPFSSPRQSRVYIALLIPTVTNPPCTFSESSLSPHKLPRSLSICGQSTSLSAFTPVAVPPRSSLFIYRVWRTRTRGVRVVLRQLFYCLMLHWIRGVVTSQYYHWQIPTIRAWVLWRMFYGIRISKTKQKIYIAALYEKRKKQFVRFQEIWGREIDSFIIRVTRHACFFSVTQFLLKKNTVKQKNKTSGLRP